MTGLQPVSRTCGTTLFSYKQDTGGGNEQLGSEHQTSLLYSIQIPTVCKRNFVKNWSNLAQFLHFGMKNSSGGGRGF